MRMPVMKPRPAEKIDSVVKAARPNSTRAFRLRVRAVGVMESDVCMRAPRLLQRLFGVPTLAFFFFDANRSPRAREYGE